MVATVLDGVDGVLAAAGTQLGVSDWLAVTQERIDEFASATGDDQWIHVDPHRAASGPFGSTIAHGYLTLALSNFFLPQLVEVRGFSMGINVGVNKVRFLAPVPAGARVRASAELADAQPVAGGVQTITKITMELEGSDKPACIIEAVSRYLT